MSISAIPSSGSAVSSASVVQTAPPAAAEAPKQVDKPAGRVAPPPPAATTPSVNTSGQKIGTTISTSA
jgi:hypothetical protein